jgi:hypothetical protein
MAARRRIAAGRGVIAWQLQSNDKPGSQVARGARYDARSIRLRHRSAAKVNGMEGMVQRMVYRSSREP